MWCTSFLPDLTPMLRLRGKLIKPALKKCGGDLQVSQNVYIAHPDQVEIGCDVFLAYGVWIQAVGGITLEDEVLVGPYVVLVTSDHGFDGRSHRFVRGPQAPIRLGAGWWIGAHCTITKGVTIGPGVAIGANSVVTSNIPSFCVAAGVPAKVTKGQRITEAPVTLSNVPYSV
jgi:maltose O-acetyltransferase